MKMRYIITSNHIKRRSFMFNRCLDITVKTVGIHLLVGGAYYLFFVAVNFASTFLVFLPYFIRETLIWGSSFIIAMFFLWKLSLSQGNKLEYEQKFIKKELIIGTIIGSISDALLFSLFSYIPRFTVLLTSLH